MEGRSARTSADLPVNRRPAGGAHAPASRPGSRSPRLASTLAPPDSSTAQAASLGGPGHLSPARLDELRAVAVAASKRAYCPYSRFPVGAAVWSEPGGVFAGCNVENASLGLTICAERNAIFQAVAGGARRIRALVIYTPTASPTAPCGACRQVLREFASDAVVLSCCDGPAVLRATVAELLPHGFGGASLG